MTKRMIDVVENNASDDRDEDSPRTPERQISKSPTEPPPLPKRVRTANPARNRLAQSRAVRKLFDTDSETESSDDHSSDNGSSQNFNRY